MFGTFQSTGKDRTIGFFSMDLFFTKSKKLQILNFLRFLYFLIFFQKSIIEKKPMVRSFPFPQRSRKRDFFTISEDQKFDLPE